MMDFLYEVSIQVTDTKFYSYVQKHRIILENDDSIQIEIPRSGPIDDQTRWKKVKRKKKDFFEKYGDIIGFNGNFCIGFATACREEDIESTMVRLKEKLRIKLADMDVSHEVLSLMDEDPIIEYTDSYRI
ncbi:hypothetical protein [Paenibacillus sp. FSL H3-0333]|uniref:hypothetical protein n=1 Tax=Paenibacillus sp. FSL H3-0333 TaxID=2921373 RepID=UPI0030F896F8